MGIANLWGAEFAPLDSTNRTKQILKKIDNPKKVESVSVEKVLKSKKTALEDKLLIITENVLKILGKQKDNTIVITDKPALDTYINRAIKNGAIAIDTETNNSLDPLTCKLMGLCLYTKGEKQAYIPVNHINYVTGERLEKQLTEQDIAEALRKIKDSGIKTIFHNAKFDYEVLKCTCGVAMPIYWDTMIAAMLLDENDFASLKHQYITKLDSSQEKYSIEHLFEGVEYAVVSPSIFALYAATDSMMTYKLYELQKTMFENSDLAKVYKLFMEVEMKVLIPTAEMELNGISVDLEYSKKLLEHHYKKLAAIDLEIDKELQTLKSKIDAWRLTPEANHKPLKANATEQALSGESAYGKSKNEQLSDPINLASPAQLAILLYDVLKVKQVSKKTPRGTGEEVLEAIDLPICKLLLKRRGTMKLISAFLEAIPAAVNKNDNKVHCKFKQLGAKTGRYACTEPNLQQVPSHAKEVRLMFTASKGYTLVGGDFSAQEPRLTSFMSQDQAMINAYKEGKDLYAVIATSIFNNDYKDNLEFYPEGTEIEFEGKKIICGYKTHLNKAGKERRSTAKTLLLALTYGMSPTTAAERFGKTKEEAQEIFDTFYKKFPKVKEWMDGLLQNLKKTGYVEDFYGRRRHLPDINLPNYTVTSKEEQKAVFNPFIGSVEHLKDSPLVSKYKRLCEDIKFNKDYDNLKVQAEKEGITIQANTGRIAQAERQCTNAAIQGSAATLTKIAMINIYNDKELNDLGFRMLVPIHDEILGECPAENAEAASKRLAQVMIDSAKPFMNVPMSVDTYVVNSWYAEEETVTLREEFKKMVEGDPKTGVAPIEESLAFEKLCENNSEFTKDELYRVIYKDELVK